MQSAAVTINISDVVIDPAFQMRVALNQDTVDEYAETITSSESGWPFHEPCRLYRIDGELFIVDGFHRFAGTKTAGRDTIEATIVDGTRTDALLAAIGSNQTHGLRRNSADKRRCVTTALGDELLSAMSDRQLAELCGVSQPFVSHIRSELITVITSEVIGADGKAYPTAATAKAKRAMIAEAVASKPDESNVKIARLLGTTDKTVASVRKSMEATPDTTPPAALPALPTVVHSALAMVPQISGEPFELLKYDIQHRGQSFPVVADENGAILDGRSRLKVCAELGITPIIFVLTLEESAKAGYVLAANLSRLNASQYFMLSAMRGVQA